MSETRRRIRERTSAVHVAIVVLFVAGLWASPLQSLVGFAQEDWLIENRHLASLPDDAGALSLLVDHRPELVDYVRDHFGLRRTLVRWHHRIKLWAFDRSPVPRLILGRDGWLFRGEHDPLDDFRPMTPLPEHLVERWRRPVRDVAALLEQRGVPLLVVVVPSKQTIYPEYLPERVLSFEHSPRVGEMLARLSDGRPLETLDLRAPVRDAKALQRTYDRTDTHWNDIGAYVGYVEIVQRLSAMFPGLEPRPISAFRLDRDDEPGGNLARMLAMTEIYREERISLTPRSTPRARRVESRPFSTPRTKEDLSFEQDDASLPRAVIFHDSFADRLIPLLAEHFSRLDCRRLRSVRGAHWSLDEERELIDTSRPDVIIWEIAERAFQRRR